MRKTNSWILSAIISMIAIAGGPSCSGGETQDPDNQGQENPSQSNTSPADTAKGSDASQDPGFAFGADPSWITEMESKGIKFFSKDGKQGDGLEVLRGIGFNAARFRVWVNPESANGYGKWCDKADAVSKAKRAQALGFRIMIDLHYSDNWADPAKQWKPKAWDNISNIDELASAAASHTKDVLSALKSEGVEVEWVQIGNETTNGMMLTQSDGKTASALCCRMDNASIDNYIKVHNKAQEAAKEIFPDAKIIVHFDRGQLWSKISWGIGELVKRGAKFDIMGLSCYPETSESNWYSTYVDALISNMEKIVSEYGKDVMICEIGASNIASWQSKRAICNTVIRARNVKGCRGVFYWEPECYAAFNGYGKGGFLSSGRPSEALEAFGGSISELLPENDPNAAGDISGDAIYIASTSGENLGTLEKQADGTYSGKIAFAASWENFTATDKDGNKYGPKSTWDNQLEIAPAHGEFNHFWIYLNNGQSGEYIITFDLSSGKWSQQAAQQ